MLQLKPLKTIIAFVAFFALSFSSMDNVPPTYKLILFEGSDWCVNCIRFEKNVLSDDGVVKFLKQQNIQIERIDFPQKKKLEVEKKDYNAKVADKYGFKGIFPTILLVNTNTDKVITLKYHDQGPSDFMDQVKSNLEE